MSVFSHPKTQTVQKYLGVAFKIALILAFVLGGGWWMWSYYYKQTHSQSEVAVETTEQKISRLEAALRDKNISSPSKAGEGKVQTEPTMPVQYGGVNGQGIHIKVPPAGRGYSAKFDPNGERELKNGDYLGNFTRIDLVHSHGQKPMYAWDIKVISPSKINVFLDGDHSISYELGAVAIPNANDFLELQTKENEEGEVVVRWVRLDTLKLIK